MKQPEKHSRTSSLLAITILAVVVIGVGYWHFGRSHAASKQASTSAAKQTPKTTPTSTSSAPAAKIHTDAGLNSAISAWASQHSFDATVVVQELSGQLRYASRGSTVQMTTASTYKVYVAYATLHQVEQGTITMNTPTRTGQTVSAALSKMILQSDNDSAEALGFLVGWGRINTLASAVGATHTNINNYDSSGNATNGNKLSTAADLALMVTKLQQGSLLSKSNTDLLLGLMKQQVWRERVPAGVPTGITVADKPGWLDDVENDAAIVYGPKSTYVIVVMTDSSTTQPLADLSRTVYNYLEQ